MNPRDGAEQGQPRSKHDAHADGQPRTEIVHRGFQLAPRPVDCGLMLSPSGIEVVTGYQFDHGEFPRRARISFGRLMRNAYIP